MNVFYSLLYGYILRCTHIFLKVLASFCLKINFFGGVSIPDLSGIEAMAWGEILAVLPEGGGAGGGTAIPWIGGGSVRGSTRGGSGVSSGGLMSRSLKEFSGSLWGIWELLGGQDNPLARSSVSRREDAQDDEEALKWAALESLPTYDHLRTFVFFNSATGNTDPVDVRLLIVADRCQLFDSLLKSSEDENQ